jgi:hypothetical protein
VLTHKPCSTINMVIEHRLLWWRLLHTNGSAITMLEASSTGHSGRRMRVCSANSSLRAYASVLTRHDEAVILAVQSPGLGITA